MSNRGTWLSERLGLTLKFQVWASTILLRHPGALVGYSTGLDE